MYKNCYSLTLHLHWRSCVRKTQRRETHLPRLLEDHDIRGSIPHSCRIAQGSKARAVTVVSVFLPQVASVNGPLDGLKSIVVVEVAVVVVGVNPVE